MEKIAIRDKENHNVSNYLIMGCGLSLDIYSDVENLIGYIRNWEIAFEGKLISGDSFEGLVKYLTNLIGAFELKQISECKKDILIIYIDNLDKIRGFFEDYITEDFTHYVQVFDFIEFRDIHPWNKTITSAIDIAKHADFLIKEIFVPEKYFYLTPNQRPRKKIVKAAKAMKDTTAKELFPEPCEFAYIRTGLFGGLCYCPYPNLVIKDPMIEVDIDSAYIFDFLIQRHVMSQLRPAEPEHWEYYLSADSVTSIGTYKIKYTCNTLKARCFKTEDGEKVDLGEYTDRFIMNNIDLKIFMSLVNVQDIKCLSLFEADLDYIPKYLQNQLVEEYIKKEELKLTLGSDDPKTQLQKVSVNGIYGDSIRKFDETISIKRAKNIVGVVPQWGIWCTSYCKAYLLGLASQLDGWYYSDTDSIYCKDTPQNRERIFNYNKSIQNEVKEFCNKFGYDYDKLQNLGTFKIKDEIVKFKAITNKIYMYKTKDDEMVLKAAGCNKRKEILDEALFGLNKIPVGDRTFGFIYNKSYFELTVKDELAEALTEYLVKLNAKS